jgi:hypothetical protein
LIHAVANVDLLLQLAEAKKPSQKRTVNWEITLDEGKTLLRKDSTPIAETTITGLTPITNVGVRVSLTLPKQPMSKWTQVVYILVQ